MWVTVEPGELLMSRILLWFRADDPDPEDRWVRGYLHEWEVVPKRTWSGEHEGVPYEVLQYGECYLRPHARTITGLMRQGLAAHAVEAALAGAPECAGLLDALDAEQRQAVLWGLAGRAVELNAVQQAEDGGLLVAAEFVKEQWPPLSSAARDRPSSAR